MPLSNEQLEQAISLRKQGLKARDIAKQFGVTKNVILGYFHRAGQPKLRPATKKHRDPAWVKQAQQMLASGQDYIAVSLALGVSPRIIHAAITRLQPKPKMKLGGRTVWHGQRLAGLAFGLALGMRQETVAQQLGVTYTALLAQLHNHPELRPKHRPRITPEDTELARQMFFDYARDVDIAAALKRDVGTVRQFCFHKGWRRSGTVTQWLNKYPDLKSVLKEQGEHAFLAQARTKAASMKLDQKSLRKHKMLTEEGNIIAYCQEVMAREGITRNAKIRLMRNNGATLEQVGACFGVTRERIRQLMAQQFTTVQFDDKVKRMQLIYEVLPLEYQQKFLDWLEQLGAFKGRERHVWEG